MIFIAKQKATQEYFLAYTGDYIQYVLWIIGVAYTGRLSYLFHAGDKPCLRMSFYYHWRAKAMFSPLYVFRLYVCQSVGNIEKRMNGFSRNFQDKSGLIQGIHWKKREVLCLTGFFICFRGNLCLLATLWGNFWTDFHEIFRKFWTWEEKQSGTCLGCCG